MASDGANTSNGNNGVVSPPHRLRLNPSTDHKADDYEDMEVDFPPLLFSSLEMYLPPGMLNAERERKARFMRDILLRYSPEGERARVQKHKEYRQKIISNYQMSPPRHIPNQNQARSNPDRLKYVSLHQELYEMNPTNFFVPSFIKAINDNTEESFRSIITEVHPGIFTFEMLQPRFCELLLLEVANFEKWVHETKFRIMRPNTMNKFGAVLDDFGLENMLDKLMEDFVRPMSRVFFPEVGGATLDTHHGFVVEYGKHRDTELSFHVDDAEVTINICLGQTFTGGELYFRGVRCEKHVHSETQPNEPFDYSHVPGHAVLHRGRHRHGARATTHGNRFNLLLWCRSSVFRELRKYQKDFSNWCGECRREKDKRQASSITALKQELLKREIEAGKEAAT